MHCGKVMKSKLCPVSFGLAWGIVFGVSMIIPAWLAFFTGHGNDMVAQMSHFYSNYDATIIGGLWGGLWGLVEGFLMGFFIALIYDWIICCCKGKQCGCGSNCGCGNSSCGNSSCSSSGCSCKSGCGCKKASCCCCHHKSAHCNMPSPTSSGEIHTS